MRIGIVYDSVFGNTAEIAKTIAAALEAEHEVQLVAVADATTLDVAALDLLVLGSPTRGFRPTPAVAEFSGGLPAGAGRRAAAFDTRLDPEQIHPAPLRWVVQAGGYAADRIATDLRAKDYVTAEPAGFLVGGTEGPLGPDEAERAQTWARSLVA